MSATKPSRTALVPLLSANIQPSSSPGGEIRTYLRKRKFIDSNDDCDLSTLNENMSKATRRRKKSKELQPSLSLFFESPSQLPSPPSSSPQSERASSKQKIMTQLHLANLGRSTHTTIHCKICQMHYNKIDPHDQKLHKKHHTSVLRGPQFTIPAATNRPLPASRIREKGDLLIITRSSPKDLQKRALHLLSIIDTALGAPSNLNIHRSQTFFPRDGKMYLILCQSRVISLVAAEHITFACCRIPEAKCVETSGIKQRAVIGISRMWTCIAERRNGWCSALLDECAAGFIFGMDCSGERRGLVAFSTPSESGMELAKRWTGREDFLVYEE